MIARIHIKNLTSDSQGQILEIETTRFTIGRKLADVILNDPQCSSQHTLIYEVPDQGLRIRDLGSKNGTYVNEQRISEQALAIGDAVRIGNTLLEILDSNRDHSASNKRDVEIDVGNCSEGATEPNDAGVVLNQWPDYLLCLPKDTQEKFADYTDLKLAEVKAI